MNKRKTLRLDRILSFCLALICAGNVSSIIYKNIYPDVPEILLYKDMIDQKDFPISFLLCLNRHGKLDKTKRYRKFGYRNVEELFLGIENNETRKRGWWSPLSRTSVHVVFF